MSCFSANGPSGNPDVKPSRHVDHWRSPEGLFWDHFRSVDSLADAFADAVAECNPDLQPDRTFRDFCEYIAERRVNHYEIGSGLNEGGPQESRLQTFRLSG